MPPRPSCQHSIHGANPRRGIESDEGFDVVRQGVLVVEHSAAKCPVLANGDMLAEEEPKDLCRQFLLGTRSDQLKDLVEIDVMDLGEIWKADHGAAIGRLELREEVLDVVRKGRVATPKGRKKQS